ncbi:hypothetical protein [Sphingomonas sp. UYP23]
MLMSACDIDPSARTAFDARVRQLQRHGLPSRDGARAAGPLDYGIVELAALATAIRLMAAFMVPSLAVRYVVERWDTLAPLLLSGARLALPASYLARRPISDETIIVIEATALADLGRQGRHDERYAGTLGNLIAAAPVTLDHAVRTIGGAGLILDTHGYMPAIVEGFARGTLATEQELAQELDRLRFSA